MPSFRAAWIMSGRSGVGSGEAAASGSAKTAPAASTVDALSMSRLESLISRMFGPAARGLDATAHLTAFVRWEFGENAARHIECRKDITARLECGWNLRGVISSN